jgi:hypothetical protein
MKNWIVFTSLVAAALTSQARITQPCSQNLTLVCQAHYLNSQNQIVLSKQAQSTFADENEDEPSLQNCAATVYMTGPEVKNTTVRIYAEKDLASQKLQISAGSSQLVNVVKDGQNTRNAYYSKTNQALSQVGQQTSLGVLVLPLKANGNIARIYVSCNSHY